MIGKTTAFAEANLDLKQARRLLVIAQLAPRENFNPGLKGAQLAR
jgi:hypothetical protein